MKKFIIIILPFCLSPIFAQTNSGSVPETLAQSVIKPSEWAKPTEIAIKSPRAKPLIHYAFTIAEPSLEVEESLDGTVQAGQNEYIIAYSSSTLGEVLSDLLQRPSVYFDIPEAIKPTLSREMGIFYKNMNIKPAEAQKLILSQISEIYNLKIVKTQKLKEVWCLSVADVQKFASWTATGRINDNTEWLPSSMNIDEKGFYEGQSNDMTTLAAGLEKFGNAIFITDSSIKAQITVEKLPIKSTTELAKVLFDKYGIAMKKVKKMVNVVEIISK